MAYPLSSPELSSIFQTMPPPIEYWFQQPSPTVFHPNEYVDLMTSRWLPQFSIEIHDKISLSLSVSWFNWPLVDPIDPIGSLKPTTNRQILWSTAKHHLRISYRDNSDWLYALDTPRWNPFWRPTLSPNLTTPAQDMPVPLIPVSLSTGISPGWQPVLLASQLL